MEPKTRYIIINIKKKLKNRHTSKNKANRKINSLS